MWSCLICYFYSSLGFVWLRFRCVRYKRTVDNIFWGSLEMWFQILPLPFLSCVTLGNFTLLPWVSMSLSIKWPWAQLSLRVMARLTVSANVCAVPETAVMHRKWSLSKHVPLHAKQESIIIANWLQVLQNNFTDY